MGTVLIVGVTIGALFGLFRSRIVALAAVTLPIAAIATAKWISSAQYPGIMISLLAVVVVPQVLYVVSGYLATRTAIRAPVVVRASQAAIGSGLHELYAPPQQVPFTMAVLLQRLSEQQGRAATA
jgi:hypothetical protein